MTEPESNGGWGHLMPLWFKPHERPIPFNTLENWGLFALVYSHSFGKDEEVLALVDEVFTVENLVRVVAGNNLLLPFLPTTEGQGYFFRHGMLPYLVSILWLEEDIRSNWLRLHELGAQQFMSEHNLAAQEDVTSWLNQREHTIFSQLERNNVHSDENVNQLLSDTSDNNLFIDYYAMFGAICLGVTALAAHYQNKPHQEWPTWFYQELSFPYRLPDFGSEAVHSLIESTAINV
jgi:hypothetical protein